MHRPSDDSPAFRATFRGEHGLPFEEWLYDKMRHEQPSARAGDLRNRARLLMAFVSEWTRLADKLDREPLPKHYAAEYACSPATASRRLQAVKFYTGAGPTELDAELVKGSTVQHGEGVGTLDEVLVRTR